MKKVVRWSLTLAMTAACGAWSARAFQLPNRDALPDFDKRALVQVRPGPMDPAQRTALDRLTERLPGVQVAFEGKLGTPRFIRAAEGFLSGPSGQGRAISPQAAAAFPAQDPLQPLKAFLQDHAALFGHGAEALETARLTRDFVTPHNGMRTVVWEQQLEGIPVFERILSGHISRRGELVNLCSQFLPELAAAAADGTPNHAALRAAPTVSNAEAVSLAASFAGENVPVGQIVELAGVNPGATHKSIVTAPGLSGQTHAEWVWVPIQRHLLRLCWRVLLTSGSRGEMFLFLVDAESGDVILRRCLTEYLSNATYNVYVSDSPSPFSPGHLFPSTVQPATVNRQMVTISALSTNASPNGWINDADNETRGNNVDAHTDWNGDNQADTPRPQGATNRVFNFTLDLTMAPRSYSNAAVVQLFYWNNWVHDKLYDLGFTEAAGNFQVDNFNRGGFGNDAVQADAQDGSGFNNANFATPPDGFEGRMQMYLFDGPNPDRDGDLDAEVVLHEYAHGLSNRRVGGGVGLSALQSRGMGEGWSDWYGLSLLSESGDDVNGNYATGGYLTFNLAGLMENYYFGIRRYPYSTDLLKNPLTFKDIDPTQADPHLGIPINPIIGPTPQEVHNQGEVWCVALWEARANLIAKFGFATGNQLILKLVTDGMNLSPANPNFLESRDAIIQADLVGNGGANFDDLWRAFAKRGMGGSAFSPDSSTTTGVEEAFDLPGLALSRAIPTDSSGNGNGAIDFNECVDLDILLVNNGRLTASNVTATLTTTNPLVTISQPLTSYPNVPPGTVATNRVVFRFSTAPNFPCGSPITFILRVASSQDSRTVRVTLNTGLIGNPVRYNNNTPLPIPDADFRGVSSPINVGGFVGSIAKATISLQINHTFDFDLDIRLVSPDGTRVVLSQFNGFSGDNYGRACTPDTERTTFDDKAAIPIAAGRPPFVGTFRPDEPLAAFNGKSGATVNGIWRLEIADVFFIDEGVLNCWSLHLSPFECRDGGGDCSTDLAVAITNSPPPHIVDSNFTYLVTVTNLGPNTARNVMLNDPLPAGVTYLSAIASQGSCSSAAGLVNCNLGTLAPLATASVQLQVRAIQEGFVTNTISVSSTVSDPFTNNNSATVITRILPPSPFIVAAGTFLVSESLAPANGGIEAGETVTLLFNLENIGSLPTSNLVVKLQSAGGVTAPSPQQDYGVLDPGGGAVAREFTFTATGTNGGVVTATLQLQDGTNNLGSLVYVYGLGSSFQLPNPSVIVLPDSGTGSLYPSPLFVSGLVGLVDFVSVVLSNLTHSFPEDLDVLLTGPATNKVMIMSDAGGGNVLNGVTFTLDDAALSLLPAAGTITAGRYRPADYAPGETMPPPAPPGPYGTNLASFHGTDPNGIWSLYVTDDTAGDQGRISGGWHLQIRTFDPVNPQSDLAITGSTSPTSVLISSNVTWRLTVTNRGPEKAFKVLVTNTLPASVQVASATASQGACNLVGGKVVCDLGDLPSDFSVGITIVGVPQSTGIVALQSRVSALVIDFVPANNAITLPANVTAASDLRLLLSATPSQPVLTDPITYTVRVTNQGPSSASAVFVTNVLPASVTYLSSLPSQGSCSLSASRVICSMGAIANGAAVQIQIMAQPTAVGLTTNQASVRASSPADPDAANNAAAHVAAVINPFLNVIAAGAQLQSESLLPPSGAIEAGETVTINFALRNIGTVNTTNLVATLLNGNGVSASSGSASYGTLVANGIARAQPFSFTASGAGGSTLTASLRLVDGAFDLGVVTYQFALAGAVSYRRTNAVPIPDVGKAQSYPSILTVSNLGGLVNRAVVTLHRLAHSYPDDLDLLLTSPDQRSVLLMSDVGGGNSVSNLTLTLDGAASSMLPDLVGLSSGIFRPTDFESGDGFPVPAPEGPYGTDLELFHNATPNGPWSLYIVDDTVGDLGILEGGWELSLTTYDPVNPMPATLRDPVRLADGRFQFTLHGEAGNTYVLQASTNLQSWTDLGSYHLVTGSLVVVDDTAVGKAWRFYRAMLE